MEVKVLGSVSPYCKDTKNCPGYLVRTNDSKILLDCGNGISRLLDMNSNLEDLNIVISHLHLDHFGEIGALAYATYVYHNLGLLNKRVKVFIPSFDSKDSEVYSYYQYITNLGSEQYLDINVYESTDKIVIGDSEISFSRNPHSIKTHSIKVSDGESTLVYSGDTGFNGNSLEDFALNSTLFICESTFLRGQKGKKDYHLCAYEAAMIADKAKVKELMLTHFWPEIDKKEYVDEAKEIYPNTIAAEEGKVLKLVNK